AIEEPCGTWLRPQSGAYKVWLEGPDYVSPFPRILNYGDEPFSGRGSEAVMPVVDSGRVSLPKEIPLPDGTGLRVLSLNGMFHGTRQRVFDRRPVDPHSPTAMPVGGVIGGIFDRATGDAVALSRRVEVARGKVVPITPVRPATGSDVLLVLQPPLDVQAKTFDLTLLDGENRKRSPDVFLHASDAIYAVWYGASGRTAHITADSDAYAFQALSLTL